MDDERSVYAPTGREQRAEVERRRQDADDRRGTLVERDRAADDLRIEPVALLPQAMADHDKALAGASRFLRRERASENRRDTQNREEVVRHRRAAQPLRPVRPADPQIARRRVGVVGAQVGERLALLAEVAQVVMGLGLGGTAMSLMDSSVMSRGTTVLPEP